MALVSAVVTRSPFSSNQVPVAGTESIPSWAMPTAAMFPTRPAVAAATEAIAARLSGKGLAAARAMPSWMAIVERAMAAAFSARNSVL
ncbi:hypothetical protein D9M68_909730 [compost metagenome]